MGEAPEAPGKAERGGLARMWKKGEESMSGQPAERKRERDAEAEGGPRSRAKGRGGVWRALGSACNVHAQAKKVRDLRHWRR